jgi:hypothetical protein
MKNYCPTCDDFTQFTFEPGDPAYAPHEDRNDYDSRGEDFYRCNECETGFSYKPKSPPQERIFQHHCSQCSGVTEFVWKESEFCSKGTSLYVCNQCKTCYNLPDDPEKRKTLADWQAKGCPLPWWFRPTQLVVLLSLIGLCVWQPLWMLVAYCVFVYALMGYEILSGQLSTVGTRRQQIIAGIIGWLWSPIWFPLYFLIMVLRPPIL